MNTFSGVESENRISQEFPKTMTRIDAMMGRKGIVTRTLNHGNRSENLKYYQITK